MLLGDGQLNLLKLGQPVVERWWTRPARFLRCVVAAGVGPEPRAKIEDPTGLRGLVGVGVVGDGAEGGVGMTGADKRVGVGSLMGFEMLV